MSESELLRTACSALWHRKGRASLTMLGIIIGIAAIIATLAIGKGAQSVIQSKISSMGDNYLYVYRGNVKAGRKVKNANAEISKPLTLRHLQAIIDQVQGVSRVTPMVISRNILVHGPKSIDTEIKAGNEHLFSILNRQIARGTSFTPDHVQAKAKVMVLGSKTAKELFGWEDPIGKKVRLADELFTVIGVAEEIVSYFGISDPNTSAYITFGAAKRHVLKEKGNRVGAIAISAQSREMVEKVSRQVRRVLRASHGLDEKSDDDFTIIDQQSIEGAANASAQVVTLLLLIIASISLIVGGVGVMNIMLVCVSERTREIGIRMALGATSKIIMRQFLYESILLCGSGGMIGVGIGILIPKVLGYFTGWNTVVSIWSVIVSLGLTSVVGVFFGYYPAKVAAQMDPVQALAEK